MRRHSFLVRSLLPLLLFMQYAAVTHAAAHHLFDNPLHAEHAQCDGFHLQQSHAQPVQAAGFSIDTATTGPAPCAVPASPRCLPDTGFHSRAPPARSPG